MDPGAFSARIATGEAIVTYRLAEQDDKTQLTRAILYESREARDVALKFEMEKGVGASFDRLAEILAHERARVA